MLSTLAEVGLVYKNRHGKYSLAVPTLGAIHPASNFKRFVAEGFGLK
jgi:hypothetical protein